MFNNQIIAGAAGQGGSFYSETIDNSVRLVGSSTAANGARFTQTFSTVDSSTDFTLNFWVKRNEKDNPINSSYAQNIFNFRSGTSATVLNDIVFAGNTYTAGDQILITDTNSASPILATTNLLRDFSAWYNIHIMADMNNATASERLKIFINGTEASYAVDNRSSYSTLAGLAAGAWTIGDYYATSYCIGSTIARWAFVDNSTLAASYFGEFSNGIWVPKALTGITWGSAGHLLDFAGTGTNQDSSGIGADTSGKDNHWAVNNIAASDVVPDSPTNNFATLNPAANFMPATLTEGNLKATPTSSSDKRYHSTFPISSGKWYCEIRIVSTGNRNHIGFWGTENTASTSVPTNYARLGVGNSSSATSGTFNGTAFTASAGDILTYAFDADDGKLYFGRNAAPTIGATADFTGLASDTYVLGQRETGTLGTTNHFNFGQDSTFAGAISAGGNADGNGFGDFKYSVPSGFLAMCSANLPEPTISPNAAEQADDYFNTVLYTGNGVDDRSITGVGFQPDWVWLKSRSNATNHYLCDVVRGANNLLLTNGANSEADVSNNNRIQAFEADGFQLGSDAETNGSARTYVGWNWKAGGTAVSNSNGSITSQVSAAPDAGFSICTWTGNGTSGATIGHGLSSAPELIFSKRRDSSGMWTTYAKPAASDAETDYLRLDGTDALADDSRIWNDTVPTASVFSVGSGTSHINTNNATHVTYCFHSVPGYSLVSSYVGNANADGTFVYTGFRPAWIMTKMSTNSSQWTIIDNTRNTYNAVDKGLVANTSAAEVTGSSSATPFVDFTSNGFKIRSSQAQMNQSGDTFIYLAFAEAPFKYANAR